MKYTLILLAIFVVSCAHKEPCDVNHIYYDGDPYKWCMSEDGKTVTFNGFVTLDIPPFQLREWNVNKDCLEIEYKGKVTKIGEGCKE